MSIQISASINEERIELDKTKREKMNKNVSKRIIETETRIDKLMLVPTGEENSFVFNQRF